MCCASRSLSFFTSQDYFGPGKLSSMALPFNLADEPPVLKSAERRFLIGLRHCAMSGVRLLERAVNDGSVKPSGTRRSGREMIARIWCRAGWSG